MRKQADADKIAEKWLAHNHLKGITAEEKASAQGWVKVNVTLDNKPLMNTMDEVYAGGWVFGSYDSADVLGFSAADWSGLAIGNETAAALVDAPRGLKTLLESKAITIKGIDDLTYDRIGSALALSLSQGLGIKETASAVNYVLDDPARSMLIARTETARAITDSNVASYQEYGITQIEWMVGDPIGCICVDLDGMIVDIGEEFSTGILKPPAHPNCVCDVAPVVPEGGIDTTGSDSGDGSGDGSGDSSGSLIHDGIITVGSAIIGNILDSLPDDQLED